MSSGARAIAEAGEPGPERPPDPRIGEHVAAVDAMLRTQLDELQQALTDAAGAAPWPDDCLDPVARLRQLLRGGKRIRPTMVLLGWVSTDLDGTGRGRADMLQASAAVELLHCFGVVHDDVMDESRTRRGQPTVHAQAADWHSRVAAMGDGGRFGDSVAVLVGDLAHSEAERLAATLPAPMRAAWRRMVLELVSGQLGDLTGAATGEHDVEAARRTARLKSGYYTVARPLQLGALAAGADAAASLALERYGTCVGEAFALRDDLLGVFGDPAETGKPNGDDLRSGKPTVLLALARSVLRGRAAAVQTAGSPAMTDAQVAVVRDAMHRAGVVESVEAMIDERVAEAVTAVHAGARAGVLSVDGVGQLTRLARDLSRRSR